MRRSEKLSLVLGGTVPEANSFVDKNSHRLDDVQVITLQMGMVGIYTESSSKDIELLLVGTWRLHKHRVSILRSAKLRKIKVFTKDGLYEN